MRALKALVIFMGILIVIGMGGLAYGLMMKFNKTNNDAAESSVMPTSPVISPDMLNIIPPNIAGKIFGTLNAILPKDTKIIEFIANGQRLLVIYQENNGRRAIKVIDVANGDDMGTIYLDNVNGNVGN